MLLGLDLFPDEAHVRLRNRVRATYLYADEDGAGVSLRRHGRVPSRNSVWRVRRLPTFALLLQSAAHGSYLADSSDLAPPGFGGRRAVLREYEGDGHELAHLDDIVWRAARADDEGDETYVLLRKHWLMSLRASGKHPVWHTGVTVGRTFHNDANSTPMMGHWAVDLIPLRAVSSSLPELKNTGFTNLLASKEKIGQTETKWDSADMDNLPSPTKLSEEEHDEGCDESILVGPDEGTSACCVSNTPFPRSYTCLGCNKEPNNCLCDKCTISIKKALQKAKEAPLGRGTFSYCLKCGHLVEGEHDGGTHTSDCIPLDTFDGSQIAWVTKKEKWWYIFAGIQSDTHFNKLLGRPFLLHSPQGWRCKVCCDHVSHDKLYGSVTHFCTIECWAYKAEAASEFSWVNTLLRSDFDRPGENCYFCNICRCVFYSGDEEHLHDEEVQPLRVITDYAGSTAAIKIEIPKSHFMASYWKSVKDLQSDDILCPNHLFRLRDDGAQRCRYCKLRLENGGGQACSLDCSLGDPIMLPRQRKLQFKQEVNKTPDAKENVDI